ncbi:MAG: hypothetical protein J5999_05695 [Oscillospiraceae bacterium]|nr:hypothetical protein [Oscillospiraceae bacterium]
MIKKFGFQQVDDIRGMFRFVGALVCGLHPSKISVSDGAIDFTYTVGEKEAVRSYSLERSDGKIVAFTNPDGTRTEALHSG